jgi:hypothetical protein
MEPKLQRAERKIEEAPPRCAGSCRNSFGGSDFVLRGLTLRRLLCEDRNMSLGTILIIILILLLLGVIPNWGYSSSWGYGPSGVVGTILIVVLILLLLGRI